MDFGHRAVEMKHSPEYIPAFSGQITISLYQPVKYNLILPDPSSGTRGCLSVRISKREDSFPGSCDKEKSVSLYVFRTPASVLCEWQVAWHRATPETQTFAGLISQAM